MLLHKGYALVWLLNLAPVGNLEAEKCGGGGSNVSYVVVTSKESLEMT